MTTAANDSPVAPVVSGNKLVLNCLRRAPQGEKIEWLKCLTEDDWNTLISTAARFNLNPLIFQTIRPLVQEISIGGDAYRTLKTAYYKSAVRNLRLHGQLSKVLVALGKEGIPVILLKGAHLSQLVYKNPALRPMADIDLLAQKQDLAHVDRILKELGYVSRHSGSALEHLEPYVKKNAVPIEVHFHITSPPFSDLLDPAELWLHAVKQSFNGIDCLTLGPEDLLLHLSVHTCIHHGFDNGLQPYVDMVSVMDSFAKELDWNILFTRARQWGMQRCLILMLELSEKMLGWNAPEAAQREMSKSDPEMDAAVTTAQDLIFHRGASVSAGIARLFEKGWRNKLKIFRERAFTDATHTELIHPESGFNNTSNSIKRYRLRLIGLCQRHARVVWAALRRDPAALAAIQSRNQRNAVIDWLRKKN